jgi:hypothetical protein
MAGRLMLLIWLLSAVFSILAVLWVLGVIRF